MAIYKQYSTIRENYTNDYYSDYYSEFTMDFDGLQAMINEQNAEWNKIIKSVGVDYVNETMLLEEADLKEWLKNAWEWIKKTWNKFITFMSGLIKKIKEKLFGKKSSDNKEKPALSDNNTANFSGNSSSDNKSGDSNSENKKDFYSFENIDRVEKLYGQTSKFIFNSIQRLKDHEDKELPTQLKSDYDDYINNMTKDYDGDLYKYYIGRAIEPSDSAVSKLKNMENAIKDQFTRAENEYNKQKNSFQNIIDKESSNNLDQKQVIVVQLAKVSLGIFEKFFPAYFKAVNLYISQMIRY